MRSLNVVVVSLLATLATPQPAAARSSGTYWAGRLRGGVALEAEGSHHYLLYPRRCYDRPALSRLYRRDDRKRNYFGHKDVVAAVKEVAARVRQRYPKAGRMPVGELSNERGGRIPRHLTHQNGLDVDVYFMRASSSRYPVARCHDGPSYEIKDRRTGRWSVHPAFEAGLNWAMIAGFARRRDVKVILIGKLLKRHLAAWSKTRVPRRERRRVLAKLRTPFCRAPKGYKPPFYKGNFCPHDDHVHVRFRCPKDSRRCRERRR